LVPWIAEANGSLFFPADDGVHGRELWKSDGTTAGTVMVRDINAPAAVRHEQPPAAWGTTTAYASTQCLVCKWGWQSFDDFTFASDTTITGVNWRGYYRHADARLNPGSPSTDYWNISFWSDSGAGPLIPVQSGTYPVASLQMTFAGYLPLEGGIGQVPVYDFHLDLQTPFVARGGRTYWFSPLSLAGRHPVEYVFGWMQAKAEPLVVQSSYQRDLQTSETFQRSVDLAFSLATHAPADIGSHPSHLTAVDNTLYFYADDGLHGSELWRSNGTPMSTTLVKDIRPGSPGSRPSAAYAAVDGKFVFPADDGVHDRELWVSDGTASGTTMVRDYDPGSGVPVWARVVEMDGAVFFAGYDAVHGAELWKTDGTQANTAMVKDITPGSAGTSYFEFLAKGHGKLFFLSDDGTHGYELWQTDGTEGGTRLVYDLWPGSRGSNPRTAAIYHDVLLFVAETESTGQELWKLKLARRDGVSRATEDAAPNGGDGNRDGTLDSLQANVTSLPNAVNAQYVTLESPGGTKLIDVAATKNPSPTNVPPGVSFPIGFLEYEVANVVPGGATTVTITVPTGATPTTYWKYGPIPGNLTPHWYEFLFDGTTGAQIMPGKIVLHLVDGGRGDDDLTANGVIVDPGALGAWVETVEQDSDGDGVVDGMEDGAPNSGDGNQDGTPDRLQPHVASLTQAHTHDLLAQPEDYATLVAAVGTQFRDVEILANPPSEQDPAGLQAAIGFVQFRLENCAPGDAATVTILRDCCPHLQSYWNYGPTADEPEPHWYEFSYDGTTGAEIFDDRIVLHLVDGLRGDADLTADGAVVTNGLPAMPTVNVPPLLNPDVFALDEDGQFAPAVPGLLENDYDFEDDGLTLVKLADPAHGQLTLGNDGSFTYVPDRDFNGLDSFEYQADDGQGGVAGAVVTLIVDPVNDAPVVASPLADVQVLEDAPATVLDLSALFDDVDRATNGDTLTLTLAGNTNPSLLAATVDNARLTLTYLADQSGTAEVTVRAMDAGGLWCEETLTVTVIDVAETWQNPDNPFDVNGRDGVTPLDVLLLVNYINAHPSDASLPAPPALPPPYYDVNNDNSCTPLDVLLVINYINSHPSGSGESEPLNTDYDEEQLGDVLNEIAADVDDAWGLLGFAGDVHHGWHREHGGQSR
jgi:ELWxxDGT repeat protein